MIEYVNCDGCNEFENIDDLIDTEGFINGGIGLICPDCIKDL